MNLHIANKSFLEGGQHVQYWIESAPPVDWGKKYIYIGKQHFKLHQTLLAGMRSTVCGLPYVILPNKHKKQGATVHFPVLLNELQSVLQKTQDKKPIRAEMV